MDITVLIAEDDSVFRQLICDIIKKRGYSVIEAVNGMEAVDKFFSNGRIDLCILDVMMPVYDGWEVLKEIRQHSDVPVMMLTALGDEKHEICGFSNGADDYIAKPFSYPIFVARVDALLRKVKKERDNIISVGDLLINQTTHQVLVGEQELILNHKEYHLLLYLVKNIHIVLTREKILEGVWGYDFDGDIRTIDAHIKMLRSKLLSCNSYIKTIRGSGYLFEVTDEKINQN